MSLFLWNDAKLSLAAFTEMDPNKERDADNMKREKKSRTKDKLKESEGIKKSKKEPKTPKCNI